MKAKAISGSISEVNHDLELHIQSLNGGTAEKSARDVNANAYTGGSQYCVRCGPVRAGDARGTSSEHLSGFNICYSYNKIWSK